MTQEARVMVAIPTTGEVDIRWCFALYKLLRGSTPGTMYSAEWRYGIDITRERLVESALEVEGLTHVFFLDSDIIPPEDTISRLLADNLQIVSGLYVNSLHTGVAAWVGDNTISLEQKSDVVPVDKVGLGCCLINLDVFRDMKDFRPWFYYYVQEKRIVSEDFYFFQNTMKHIGVRPYVDMRVRPLHIKQRFFDPAGNATDT